MVKILDTTLREGEQTPGVKFSYSQKLKIAKLLDEFGIDFIEVGNPSISSRDKNDILKLAKNKFKASLICYSRARIEDVDNVIDTGVKWIGMFAGINKISLESKFGGRKKEELFKIIKESIVYAKKKKLKVRFTIEDATRTKFADVKTVIKIAEKADADRISLADTLGVFTPLETFNLIKKIKKITKIPLNVHFHDDFGMANANAIIAYEAGADLIDVTVNALGERNGINSLSKTILALKELKGVNRKWNLKLLPEISKVVSQFSKIPPGRGSFFGNRNFFTHTAGLHTRAILKNKKSYQSISAESLGLKTRICINEMSSRDAFKYYLKNVKNIFVTDKEFEKKFSLLKKGRLKSYHGYFDV